MQKPKHSQKVWAGVSRYPKNTRSRPPRSGSSSLSPRPILSRATWSSTCRPPPDILTLPGIWSATRACTSTSRSRSLGSQHLQWFLDAGFGATKWFYDSKLGRRGWSRVPGRSQAFLCHCRYLPATRAIRTCIRQQQKMKQKAANQLLQAMKQKPVGFMLHKQCLKTQPNVGQVSVSPWLYGSTYTQV